MPSAYRRGYDFEKRVCEALGLRRLAGPYRIDGENDLLAVEIRKRKTFPKWIGAQLDSARRKARGEQVPLFVFGEERQRIRDVVVCMRLGDFVDLHGGRAV